MPATGRRTILRQTALATGAFFVARNFISCSPSRTVNVAVVGFREKGGRGEEHLKAYTSMPGVRLAAICDVNQSYLDHQAASLKSAGVTVQSYQDIRKLLENGSIDAVSIATPNHWHALAGIWAMQAGKDVYVEKPVSHNVWEGRQLVNAARQYSRIAQTGSQCRSSTSLREAVAWVKAGNIGRIQIARGLCYKRRPPIGRSRQPLAPAPDIDLDLWFGPAPKTPLLRRKLDYDWHWQWDCGNGDLGNQGVHQMDIARWFLGEDGIAPLAWSVGGRLGYDDDGETPNTQIVYQGYKSAPLIFEVRGLPSSNGGEGMDEFMGAQIGCVIHCENGHVVVPGYSEAVAFDNKGRELKRWKASVNHFENFISAVKRRKREDLNAEILEGHVSAAICHTGNISHRLGAGTSVEEIRKSVESHAGATETLERTLKHLEANGVDLAATPLTLGPQLRFDPKTEQVLGNDNAAKLMTREYRAPFTVPKIAG